MQIFNNNIQNIQTCNNKFMITVYFKGVFFIVIFIDMVISSNQKSCKIISGTTGPIIVVIIAGSITRKISTDCYKLFLFLELGMTM